MKKLFSIILFTLFIFLGSNTIQYSFNITNFLFANEIILNKNTLKNYILISSYFIFFEGILLLLFNRFFYRLNKSVYYFVLSCILSIIFLFIFKIILKNEKISDSRNVLSLVLTIFLTTYTFYYSIYEITLIKYKRNI